MDVIEELTRHFRDAAGAGGIHFGAGVCEKLVVRLEAVRRGRDEEVSAMEAVMTDVDPATWPNLTFHQRAALARFAKPFRDPNTGRFDRARDQKAAWVRYDLAPAGHETAIRTKLIEMGWTPPAC